ncbi:PH domain-containing protein [Aquibacillus koreensis]|uniref:PH domain-containing protein n=1 Tax=Aquibacillus koreensis TaxID=279446 RepID=A0A9X3WNQ0_9BACI|nr:PH domain-containing protein [Aquibacillus koreensis]MCT2535400.1 PH domain-containing protein [Aquibacillus koreensis]MDC3422235.1 PH domain-containing protein [Aquibacillus koreensis]
MRYHPLTMVFRLSELVKNSLFIVLILFVLKKNSEFWLVEYGRYAFVLFVLSRIVYIIIAWFVETYEWQDHTFQIHKGIFVKHTSSIPFSRIQNITRKTTLFHKVFGLTSLTFETAMDGENDAIHFEVLSKNQASSLISLVKQNEHKHPQETNGDEEVIHSTLQENDQSDEKTVQQSNRTIHFTPKRKDLWKASFTSLSFLAIIPLVAGGYDYLQPFLPDTDEVEGLFQGLLASVWIFIGIIMVAVVLAIGFGIVRTFIRFGKYEISSDYMHIYIDRGVLNESYFAIEKRKIQGLEINQTWIKRIFGLAEVKLVSSANPGQADESVNVNSLYPFLPIDQAYRLIEELLPDYQLNEKLERLPRKSLWLKLFRPSWLWIIATIVLWYFKPAIFQIDQAWWIVSVGLLCFIVVHRILDYIHTRYVVTGDQLQWWHGGLTSRMFVTKRKNVIEMAYSQSRIQRYFNVASITTINRSVPAHIEQIKDIPLDHASAIEDWYRKRREEVRVVK